MKRIVFLLLVFWSFFVNAQDTLISIRIADKYASLIEFSGNQKDKFLLILEKYNLELYKKDIDKQKFNKANKLRDLEVFKLLNPEQFTIYKEAKSKIEPSLIFRFQ